MPEDFRLSQLAETLTGSEIVRMNGEIRQRMGEGHKVFNLTIGDFDPQLFPIPAELEEEIVFAYRKHLTNYPASEGEPDLRKAIARYITERRGLSYGMDEILVASGGRPLIYTLYRSIVDPGESVIYPVPSWNNNHYVHFVGGAHTPVLTTAQNRFMPSAEDLRPHLTGAVLLALSSPLNPSGTTFSRSGLAEICEMVAEENRRRPAGAKKLYILFDQIYWQLTHKGTEHVDPVSLCPELKPYTVFVDGISKCFAATGVRVGWSLGPAHIISRMKSILSHMGAWSPMPEQMATARYLLQKGSVDSYLFLFKRGIFERLDKIHKGLLQLKKEGYPVDSMAPQASIYLSVRVDLKGRAKTTGQVLDTQQDVTKFLLEEAGWALVPFQVFGMEASTPWYRLSIGTVKTEEIRDMLKRLKDSLQAFA